MPNETFMDKRNEWNEFEKLLRKKFKKQLLSGTKRPDRKEKTRSQFQAKIEKMSIEEATQTGSPSISDESADMVLAVQSLENLLKLCFYLRRFGRCYFRGQRRHEWLVQIRHRVKDEDQFATLDSNLRQFRKRCMEFSRRDYVEEKDKWRWEFLAQHSRLPTRLIDWTTNPLVACYFAVEEIESRVSKNESGHDVHGAVWALFPKSRFLPWHQLDNDLNAPDSIPSWRVIDLPPISERLARQSGKFTFHPNNTQAIIARHYLEADERLLKIIINPKEGGIAKIRQQLGILNIHYASLFPNEEGVAKFIDKEWGPIARY